MLKWQRGGGGCWDRDGGVQILAAVRGEGGPGSPRPRIPSIPPAPSHSLRRAGGGGRGGVSRVRMAAALPCELLCQAKLHHRSSVGGDPAASLNRQETRRASERRGARQRRDPWGFLLSFFLSFSRGLGGCRRRRLAGRLSCRRSPGRSVISPTWGRPRAAETFEGYFAPNLDTRRGADSAMGGGEAPRRADPDADASLRGGGGGPPWPPWTPSGSRRPLPI